MRERPILFSAPMVVAIEDGSKTVTRRLIKYNPFLGEPEAWVDRVNDADFKQIVGDYTRFCPYRTGDHLWVKETFAAPHAYDHLPPRLIPRDARIHYAASEERGGLLWRSPLFMPRTASRIALDVTAIRAERVQDITNDDSLREGIHPLAYEAYESPRMGFRELWERTYPGSWDRNDAVWVVDFQRVDG